MPISYLLMPKRHEAVTTVALMDVSPRLVALAYSKHRSVLELDEYAKLAMSVLGNGRKNVQRP